MNISCDHFLHKLESDVLCHNKRAREGINLLTKEKLNKLLRLVLS